MIYLVDGNLPVDSIIHLSNNWGSHVTRRIKMGVQTLEEGKFDHLMLDWKRDNLAAASYLVDCCRTDHGILAFKYV